MTTGLLVASVDFGYGSSGKLSSILAELPEYRCVLAGSTHSRHITRRDRWAAYYPDLSSVEEIRDVVRRHRLGGALVVLNPDLAGRCVHAGLPTVYVDSLPFLWTEHDPVPVDATVYCAQMFPLLPRLSWSVLRRIRDLRWVGGIVPRVRPDAAPAGSAPDETLPAESGPAEPYDAVVNLGGVGTHLLRPDDAAYPVIVVDAVLSAMSSAGHKRVRVTGNVPRDRVAAIVRRHGDLDVTLGPVRHGEFQILMATAPVLLTSPGLTTLIESSALGRPAVVLPPQNLSQFFNADAVAMATAPVDPLVRWPHEVVDRERLEEVRRAGEDAALRHLYAAFAAHEGDPRLVAELAARIESAIRRVDGTDVGGAYARLVGRDGAAEVAAIIRETIPAAGRGGAT